MACDVRGDGTLPPALRGSCPLPLFFSRSGCHWRLSHQSIHHTYTAHQRDPQSDPKSSTLSPPNPLLSSPAIYILALGALSTIYPQHICRLHHLHHVHLCLHQRDSRVLTETLTWCDHNITTNALGTQSRRECPCQDGKGDEGTKGGRSQ